MHFLLISVKQLVLIQEGLNNFSGYADLSCLSSNDGLLRRSIFLPRLCFNIEFSSNVLLLNNYVRRTNRSTNYFVIF